MKWSEKGGFWAADLQGDGIPQILHITHFQIALITSEHVASLGWVRPASAESNWRENKEEEERKIPGTTYVRRSVIFVLIYFLVLVLVLVLPTTK